MKKLVLFVAVVAAASFASCKKDRTCTCDSTTTTTYTNTTSGGTVTTTTDTESGSQEVIYTEAKKGDARAACLSYTTSDSDSEVVGGTTYAWASETTVDCSLSK